MKSHTFLDAAAFRRHATDIVWESEVWLAECPDHMIHYNGSRFLGPYPATSSNSDRVERTREEILEFPGSIDGPWRRFVHDADSRGIGTVRYPRLIAKDDECAKQLAKRTLTNLYNPRPTWLDLAHKKLDEAVFAAYGWPPDLTDDQILEKLLALNLERAAAEK